MASRLAASRFTSHSHGPGMVSSKSLMSKIIWRSGVAKSPKLERCASPQSWTVTPDRGVVSRSVAMSSAAPRKKVNGEASMRPYRIGTSSGSRVAPCCSSRPTGSGRSAAGSNTRWLVRGAVTRAALPRARRSSTLRCSRRHDDANGRPDGAVAPPLDDSPVPTSGLTGPPTGRPRDHPPLERVRRDRSVYDAPAA